MPVYLNWLLARFLSIGGRISRASVSHISQVLEGAFSRIPDALIVCTGLGARTLGGVEDKEMYPQRGQTVLIHAPWVTSGCSLVASEGSRTYIILRRGGNVSDPTLGRCLVLTGIPPVGRLFLVVFEHPMTGTVGLIKG